MSKPTFFSLFTGGDLAGEGAKAAGCEVIGGVEYDAAIAEVARANGCPVTVSRVEDADPMKLTARPDVLWASPVCTRASVANANAGETEADRTAARAVAHWIQVLEPTAVFIENVMGYRHFESFGIIRAALDKAGYWSQATIENAASYGVPQTRKRLILRAVREGCLPPVPAPVPWRGWYEAIEDLLPELPDWELLPWQKRLMQGSPAPLSLYDPMNARRLPTVRASHQPCVTVTSHWGERPSHPPLCFLPERIVQTSPRCAARFQCVPDPYLLPDSNSLAFKVIGNGVACLLARRLIEQVLPEATP